MRTFRWLACLLLLLPAGLNGQNTTETISINKVPYYKTSIQNLVYLYEHIDQEAWRKLLEPLGYTNLGLTERSAALHHVKGVYTGLYHVITFDSEFGVVAMTWSDPSGKISMLKDIQKELSKYPHQTTSLNTFYTVEKNGTRYTISLRIKREGQRLLEETTIEMGR